MLHAFALYQGPTRDGKHRYATHCGLLVDMPAPAAIESTVKLAKPDASNDRCTVCLPTTVVDEDGDASSLDTTLGGAENTDGLGGLPDDSGMGELESDEPV